MSILSGLRTFFLGDDGLMHEVTSAQSGRYAPIGPWLLGSDVREALRSDETRAAIAVVLENTLCSCRRREEAFFGGFCGECEADAVVALLAGGDDD